MFVGNVTYASRYDSSQHNEIPSGATRQKTGEIVSREEVRQRFASTDSPAADQAVGVGRDPVLINPTPQSSSWETPPVQ